MLTPVIHSDEELLLLIRNKDRNAIWELYQHGLRIAKSRLNGFLTEEGIKDVYAEAFNIFLENVNREGFVLSSKLTTYLTGIVRYRGISEVREEKLREYREISEVMDDFEDDLTGLQMKQERLEIVLQELEKMKDLKNDCYQIILLGMFEGKSNATIAKILNKKNEDVVASQKSQCISKLKKEVFKNLKLHG